MKKIFYICQNPIENWDIFTAQVGNDQAQSIVSLLLLHKEQDLEGVSVSQVWYLKGNETEKASNNTQKTLSYQEFLEEVFSHDLSVVI